MPIALPQKKRKTGIILQSLDILVLQPTNLPGVRPLRKSRRVRQGRLGRRKESPAGATHLYVGKVFPNMGRLLIDCSSVASS